MSELVSEIAAECTGTQVWRVADPEGNYCIEFRRRDYLNPEQECRAWFDRQKSSRPQYITENEYSVVDVRVFPRSERLALAAAAEIARLSAALAEKTAQRDAYRAVLEGAEYNGLDELAHLPVASARQVGEAAATISRSLIAARETAVAQLEEERARNSGRTRPDAQPFAYMTKRGAVYGGVGSPAKGHIPLYAAPPLAITPGDAV